MTRNLKALGLALFAAFAMSAVAASAASADMFVASPETVVTAEDHTVAHLFTYGLGEVECEVTNFSGTSGEKEEETSLTVTPTYDKCTLFDEPAVVRTNHCYYVFTSHTDGNGDAPVHIECENAGEHIEVEVVETGCTVTVAGGQTTGNGVSYASSEGEVTATVTAEVEATRDNPTSDFLCSFLPSSGTGEYTGNSILKGYEISGEVPTTENEGITWTAEDGHETEGTGITHWKWGEGDQVGISVNTTG